MSQKFILCFHGDHANFLIYTLNCSHINERLYYPVLYEFSPEADLMRREHPELPYVKYRDGQTKVDVEVELDNLSLWMYNLMTRGCFQKKGADTSGFIWEHRSRLEKIWPEIYAEDPQVHYPMPFTIHEFEKNPLAYIINSDITCGDFFEIVQRTKKIGPIKKKHLLDFYQRTYDRPSQIRPYHDDSFKIPISYFYDEEKLLEGVAQICHQFNTNFNASIVSDCFKLLQDAITYDHSSIGSDGSVLSEFLDLKACSN